MNSRKGFPIIDLHQVHRFFASVLLGAMVLSIPCFAEETIQQLKQKAIDQRPLIEPPYSAPILLTSIGQGSGASLAGALLGAKARLPVEFLPLAATEEVARFKTLMINVELSHEALQQAESNFGTENLRMEGILSEAKRNHIPVVFLYLGSGRDFTPRFQPFIDKALLQADLLIVLDEGNREGFFTKKAEDLGAPLIEIRRLGDLIPAVEGLLRPQASAM